MNSLFNRKVGITMKIDGSDAQLFWKTTKNGFYKILDDFEYFQSEGLAQQVVKEVFSLPDNKPFKVLKYTFTKREI
jgi:hypothetical protein